MRLAHAREETLNVESLVYFFATRHFQNHVRDLRGACVDAMSQRGALPQAVHLTWADPGQAGRPNFEGLVLAVSTTIFAI